MSTGAVDRITHPDKLYWPDEGYTKLDLVRYYQQIFPRLEPWVKDRLLVLERCPEGVRGQCFFQKERPAGLPAGTRTQRVQHESGVTNYVIGGSLRTQLALVNLGTIAVHVWSSRVGGIRKPDWLAFDLDPSAGRFSEAVRAALWLHEFLDEIGLRSYPKTTGGKGLHVFVPLRTGPDTDTVLEFAQGIGSVLAELHPRELTIEPIKSARRDRLYLDAQRNAFAQTVVAPYAVRHRPGAPVSMPLAWSEVSARLDPTEFHIDSVPKLRRRDPWADFFRNRQGLGAATRALASIRRALPGAQAPPVRPAARGPRSSSRRRAVK